MKVLHVASNIDAASGGPAVAIGGLVRAQRDAGLSPTLVLTYPGGRSADYATVLSADGIPTVAIGPCGGKINRHPDIRPTLERLVAGADVVHIHALWEDIQHHAAVVCRKRGVPYVITPHGMLDPWSLRQRAWLKKLFMLWRVRHDLERAALLHYITSAERDLAAPLKLRPASVVEPIGLDDDEFAVLPPRGAFRSRHSIAFDRKIVLFLGRIHYKKGLDLLIPAFASGAPSDALLVIAGPDHTNYLATARRLVQEAGLGDRTLFTGMLRGPERIEALVDGDVFALSSYQENFGIAVVEAMACGVAVVVSDQVNSCTEVTESDAGIVVRTKVEAVGDAIRTLLSDDAARAAMGRRGRVHARSKFGWSTIATNWTKHYQSVANNGKLETARGLSSSK